MPMSKKDFEAIAAAIRDVTTDVLNTPSPIPGYNGHKDAVEVATKRMVFALCDTFRAANPRFDRERFIAACSPHTVEAKATKAPAKSKPSDNVDCQLTASSALGTFALTRKDGTPVYQGEKIPFGRKRFLVLGMDPPHKDSSEGYVTTEAGRYYAGVYGVEWVRQ